MSLTGFPGNPPTRGGGSLGDYVAGAVRRHRRAGARSAPARARVADRRSTSRARTPCSRCSTAGRASSPPPAGCPEQVGNRHLGTAPYDCYRARDGWVVIAVASNKLFRTLATAIGRPELGDDPRFRGVTGRVARSDEINGIVGAWVAERTRRRGGAGARARGRRRTVLAGLHRRPAAHASAAAGAGDDPAAAAPDAGRGGRARGRREDVRHARRRWARSGPEIGEHSAEVYRELLGLSDEELAALRARQVI